MKKRNGMMAAGAFAILFTGFPHIWSIYQPYVLSETGWSESMVSICFYLPTLFFVVGNIFGGRIYDKGYGRITLGIGGSVFAGGIILSALTLGIHPMFTSCCPGWVRFIKSQYPQMVNRLSSAKSPQEMFGAVMKTAFAKKMNIDPDRIFALSIMPCVAKKDEREKPLFHGEFAGHGVDCVLTTRELDRLIRADHIDPKTLKDAAFDTPFTEGTGAGVIFGATGGVMEAALRSAYYLITGKNPEVDAFKQIRGVNKNGWTEAQFEIAGNTIDIAVVSGLQNTRNLMEAIQKREVHYHFVEVMACPGGCVGGGGQPIHEGKELASDRGSNLYFLDKTAHLRFSHENPDIKHLYDEYFGSPGSHKAHQLLHVQK